MSMGCCGVVASALFVLGVLWIHTAYKLNMVAASILVAFGLWFWVFSVFTECYAGEEDGEEEPRGSRVELYV